MEISVTERLEVLVARIASGETMPSSSRKMPFLISSGLDDGLDDEVGVVQVLHRGAERDPAEQLGRLLLGELLALDRAAGGVLEVLAAAGDAPRRSARRRRPRSRCGRRPPRCRRPWCRARPRRWSRRCVRLLCGAAQSCARSLVDRLATVHLSATLITTRGPCRSSPIRRSSSRSRRSNGSGSVDLDEAEAGVERPVPRQVAVRRQREPVVPGVPGLAHRRADQRGRRSPAASRSGCTESWSRCANPSTTSTCANPTGAPTGPTTSRKPGVSSRSPPLGAGDSSGSPVRSPKRLLEQRPAGVLDRREVLEVGGPGGPDPMSPAVRRRSAPT